MTDPFILSQLRAEASEIESHIESLSGRLANARSDLIHVMATIRMFDPSPEDAEPAKSYHSSELSQQRASPDTRGTVRAVHGSPERRQRAP